MRTICFGAMFVLGALLSFSISVSAQSAITIQSGSSKECPQGTLLELNSGQCALIRDVTGNRQPKLSSSQIAPPSLLKLRRQQLQFRQPGLKGKSPPPGGPPPPGGIGAGTTYLVGAIRALDSSALYTQMFVQPDGINPSNSGLDWLFTTATNRTEQGVEVVGIYNQNNPGVLGIYDWSCSTNSPCNSPYGTFSEPSWVWFRDFSSLTCNIKKSIEEGAHTDNIIQYVNKTTKLANYTSKVWENSVFLWNSCDHKWDMVWEHRYQSDQVDCSTENACGWWGPIFETFPSASGEPFPEINELGFEKSAILHDGRWSDLSPAETNFDPPVSPWLLFELDPNRGYAAGSYVTALTKDQCKNGGWKNYGFENHGECIKCANTGKCSHQGNFGRVSEPRARL